MILLKKEAYCTLSCGVSIRVFNQKDILGRPSATHAISVFNRVVKSVVYEVILCFHNIIANNLIISGSTGICWVELDYLHFKD